jgi:hypothetical protein
VTLTMPAPQALPLPCLFSCYVAVLLHITRALPAASGTQKGWCPRNSCNWMDCFQHVNSDVSYGLHVQWVRSGACMRQTCLRAGPAEDQYGVDWYS